MFFKGMINPNPRKSEFDQGFQAKAKKRKVTSGIF
jgi:hypothetical protein